MAHVSKASNCHFPLTTDTTLPLEVADSLEFTKSAEPNQILEFWEIQFGRLSELVSGCSNKQLEWPMVIPKEIEGAQSKFNSAAYRQLLRNAGLGGDKWALQFIYGCPTTGCFPP